MADTSQQGRVVLHLVMDTDDAEQQLDMFAQSRDDMSIKVDADTSSAQTVIDELTAPTVTVVTGADTAPAETAFDALTQDEFTVTFGADTSQVSESVKKVSEEEEEFFRWMDEFFGETENEAAASAARMGESFVDRSKAAAPEITQAADSVQQRINDILSEAESTSASKAMRIGQIFRTQGEGASESMKHAWQLIDRESTKAQKPLKQHSSLLTKLRGYVSELIVKIKSFGSEGDKSGKKADKALSLVTGTAKTLMTTLGSVFAVSRVIAWGKACVSASTETENAFRGLSSILGGQGRDFSQAQDWIQGYISDGLVPLENAVTAYKNLASRGYDDTQIRAVLTALKDSAAYGRQASYSLGEAVTSATEGLKNENSILVDNAGVTKNVAKMWEDYAKSVGTSTNNLTQAQKIQAEVNGILYETRFQTGDAAKVAGTFSGRVSQLSANLTGLRSVAGDFLKTAAAPLLGWLNTAVKASTVFLRTIADALGISTDVSGMQSLASGVSQAAENTDDLTASLQTAKKAQDALKAASFDDFNVIGTQEEETQTAAPDVTPTLDSSAYLSGADEMSDSMDRLTQKAQGFAEMWLAGWDTVKGAWNGFKENWQTGWSILKEDWLLGKDMILGSWSDWQTFWENMGGKAYDFTSEFGENWLLGLGTIKDGWVDFWERVGGRIYDFTDSTHKKWQTGWANIKTGWSGFWKNRRDEWDAFWTDKGVKIVGFVSGMGDNWSVGMQSIREGWSSGLASLGDKWHGFKNNWSSGAETIRSKLGELRSDWRIGFDELRQKAGEKWTDVSAKIKEPFEKIGDWFHDKFHNAWERVKSVFNPGGAVFQGIKAGIDTTFKGTVNSLIDGINAVISEPFSSISWVLGTLKAWEVYFPWYGGYVHPFEWIPDIAAPQIPHLATGGLVTQPTLAMVGDNPNAQTDPEVVSPLSKLRDMLPEQGDSAAQIVRKLDSLIQLLQLILSAVQSVDTGAGFVMSDKAVYAAAERGRRRFDKMKGVT